MAQAVTSRFPPPFTGEGDHEVVEGGMRERETRSRRFAKSLRRRMTDAETILWSRLRRGQLNGWKFRRQHPVGPYIADFACVEGKLIVEVDGATHSSEREVAYDAKRSTYLTSRDFSIRRVWNTDIYENLDGVMDGIHAALAPLGPSGHSPRKQGEKENAAVVSSIATTYPTGRNP
jgi:very-short-patch-repair endonuclease